MLRSGTHVCSLCLPCTPWTRPQPPAHPSLLITVTSSRTGSTLQGSSDPKAAAAAIEPRDGIPSSGGAAGASNGAGASGAGSAGGNAGEARLFRLLPKPATELPAPPSRSVSPVHAVSCVWEG